MGEWQTGQAPRMGSVSAAGSGFGFVDIDERSLGGFHEEEFLPADEFDFENHRERGIFAEGVACGVCLRVVELHDFAETRNRKNFAALRIFHRAAGDREIGKRKGNFDELQHRPSSVRVRGVRVKGRKSPFAKLYRFET